MKKNKRQKGKNKSLATYRDRCYNTYCRQLEAGISSSWELEAEPTASGLDVVLQTSILLYRALHDVHYAAAAAKQQAAAAVSSVLPVPVQSKSYSEQCVLLVAVGRYGTVGVACFFCWETCSATVLLRTTVYSTQYTWYSRTRTLLLYDDVRRTTRLRLAHHRSRPVVSSTTYRYCVQQQ